MTDPKSRLDAEAEKLKARLAQIKAKRQQLEARERAAAAKQKRTEDTRRKILLGALYLQRLEQQDSGERETIIALLDRYLTRPDDRALFGLPEQADNNK